MTEKSFRPMICDPGLWFVICPSLLATHHRLSLQLPIITCCMAR